jgi:biopolymer transport protein ExbD
MNSNATYPPRRSKHVLLNVAVVLATALFALHTIHAQQLQKGVSVQMAATSNAISMPEADYNDAWVVTVTADGSLYFAADAMTPEALSDWMRSHPRNREAKLYIKADARAPFADVRRVLAAAHEVGFNAPVFLTSQTESRTPGVMLPPKGLEVEVGPHSDAATVVVQVNSGQPPVFQVNDQEIPATDLQDTLRRLLQSRSDTPVLVKTHGPVLFAPVVHAIDACRSIGAKVMISTPEL